MIARSAVESMYTTAHELARRYAANPLKYIRWLPSQERVLRCRDLRRLYRAGNQSLGKTTVGLAEVVFAATGEHPYRTPSEKPGEYWVICASWSQSVAIQNKLAKLLPADVVHPETLHDELRGFRGKNPALRLRHKSGGWSTIRFKTTQQGTIDLAGATVHGVLFDEPPSSQAIYSEVAKRVQATGGWVLITMTPVGAPVDWIKDEADAGRITDLHFPLTPDALIPVGSQRPIRLQDGTPCDAAWIVSIIEQTPLHEVPVRIHGEWEMRVTDRYFSGFISSGPRGHVHDRLPTGVVRICLGIDYGSKPGKQVAYLVAVNESLEHPSIYVLDEYCDALGGSLPEVDARGVMAMLARNRLAWKNLDYAHGDRVHMPGSGGRKSNKDLAQELAKLLGAPLDALQPPMRTVKRGQGHGGGSVSLGSRYIFHAMARPGGFGVHPRCARLIEALDRYTMADDDWKDPVDAVRYAIDPYIFGAWRSQLVTPLRRK